MSLSDVENRIQGIPVIAVPDENKGQLAKALIVLKKGKFE